VDEIPGRAGPLFQCKRGGANRQYRQDTFDLTCPDVWLTNRLVKASYGQGEA